MISFGPFILSINKNEIFFWAWRFEFSGNSAKPLFISIRRGVLEDNGIFFFPCGVVPRWRYAWKTQIWNVRFREHPVTQAKVIGD